MNRIVLHLWTFLSTLSVRRATANMMARLNQLEISIHALREESDVSWSATASPPSYFYPRSP